MNSLQNDDLVKQVRVMQLITIALAMGVLVFGIVVVAMGPQEDRNPREPAPANQAGAASAKAPPAEAPPEEAPEEQGQPLIAYMGALFALLSFGPGLLLPRFLARQGAGKGGLVELYQTTLIIGMAIFEGAAFFNLVAYMIDGQAFSVAIAAILFLIILMHFPQVSRVQEWLEQREREASDRQALGQS